MDTGGRYTLAVFTRRVDAIVSLYNCRAVRSCDDARQKSITRRIRPRSVQCSVAQARNRHTDGKMLFCGMLFICIIHLI